MKTSHLNPFLPPPPPEMDPSQKIFMNTKTICSSRACFWVNSIFIWCNGGVVGKKMTLGSQLCSGRVAETWVYSFIYRVVSLWDQCSQVQPWPKNAT